MGHAEGPGVPPHGRGSLCSRATCVAGLPVWQGCLDLHASKSKVHSHRNLVGPKLAEEA